MRFSIQQNTLQGKRHQNQDRMGYIFTPEALLLVVCDGLGGHGNGEFAAAWALQTLGHRFQHFASPTIDDPQAFLEASIVAAHGHIVKKTALDKLSTSPRTTIVCALLQNGQAWIAHAGDSRAYVIRGGQLLARTKDHSKLQYLIDSGHILPHEVTADHPERNRLINCLGADMFPAVDHTGPFTLLEQDTLLLCSDGLWGTLADTDIFSILDAGDLADTLPELVRTASAAGGEHADDATGMAVRWLKDDTAVINVGLADTADKHDTSSPTTHHAFESTVHLNITPDVDIRMMSDEEIDASIAEINQALAKFKSPAVTGLSVQTPDTPSPPFP
jgi:PPM family protein phosphatase